MSYSLWPHGLQHARPPCPSQLLELTQAHVYWVSHAIQPSHLLSSPSPLAFNLSQHQGFFQRVSSSHRVAKLLKLQPSVLPMNIQSWFPLGLTGSPCSPRHSQESSPAPQFKGINSSAFSLLYGPTLTTIHDYWKKHSFDYTDKMILHIDIF